MMNRTFETDREKVLDGVLSVESILEYFLQRIASENGRINAFIDVDTGAREAARRVDVSLAEGTDLPLAGMIVGVKDVLAREGKPLSCASNMLAGFTSVFTATAVERLEAQGAVVIGRTNCDEFAMGSSNENSIHGPARNPHDTDRVCGGSSGGSAAAVAAGLCHVALGSDTGGSVRQPAAFCGTIGLKPTYGRISRSGLVAFASSLDCVGPIANTVGDVAAAMQFMAGHDPKDATSSVNEVPNYRGGLPDPGTLRVGIPNEYFADDLPTSILRAVEQSKGRLKEAGVEFDEVSLPNTPLGVSTYYILACAEASSNLARYDGVRYGSRSSVSQTDEANGIADFYARNRTAGFGEEVKRRLMLGTYVLSAGYYDKYYARAQAARRLIKNDFDKVFESVDVLLTPVTPTTAYPIGTRKDRVLETYQEDIFTVTANLAGIPAISVPIGTDDEGLPVGVQLLSHHFNERSLLALAGELLSESNKR
ncbi:MAG: Asp-tRNA(Asn)/Glu-tRNA(Gln) amidotransferase subunit GatA [Rhodothermales bacterium]|nr:Asp-tRNA(Asn)/Glu-tRNA(Gln) amidotransferase subunit GatA [Rhodothermales bacterium]